MQKISKNKNQKQQIKIINKYNYNKINNYSYPNNSSNNNNNNLIQHYINHNNNNKSYSISQTKLHLIIKIVYYHMNKNLKCKTQELNIQPNLNLI